VSKIEKALKRAREERQTGVLALRPQETAVTSKEVSSSRGTMVAAASDQDVQDEVESRLRAAHAIAQMRETVLRSHGDLAEQRIIAPSTVESSIVRAFREIRTKLLQRSAGHNCVVMVTSVSHQGGSTFVAANMGVAFAFDAGKTAVLVDCNLRTPGLQQLLAVRDGLGLTDYLSGDSPEIGDIIHSVGIERLRVIPIGTKRDLPAEYFTSLKMKQFINGLKKRYRERFIILDAPPMSESADTQILSELCDFVVLVVPYGKVTVSEIDNCVRAIDRGKLLGVVFNDEPVLPGGKWQEWLPAPLRDMLGRIQNWIGLQKSGGKSE